jgi:hypothetical protein
MKRLGVLASVLLAVVGWSAAHAGPPSVRNSYVAPRLVTCPAGDSTFVVIVRMYDDVGCNEGCVVNVHLCSCPGYHLSRAGSHPYTVDSTGCLVTDSTNALGEAFARASRCWWTLGASCSGRGPRSCRSTRTAT